MSDYVLEKLSVYTFVIVTAGILTAIFGELAFWVWLVAATVSSLCFIFMRWYGSKVEKNFAAFLPPRYWLLSLLIGLPLGSGFALLNSYFLQKEFFKPYSCGMVCTPARLLGQIQLGQISALSLFDNRPKCAADCARRYLEDKKHPIKFFSAYARKRLMQAHKDTFADNKTKASALRLLLECKEFPGLEAAQQAQLRAFFKRKGEPLLRKLYDEGIARYIDKAKKASKTNYKARQAIVAALRYARKHNRYGVALAFKRKTKALNTAAVARVGGHLVETMRSSFTKEKNEAREGELSRHIEEAFAKSIPRSLLSFEATGDIVFRISYTVLPSGTVYTNEKTARKVMGVLFKWHFSLEIDGKQYYQLKESIAPAPTFRVRQRRRNKPVQKDAVYDAMASTVFRNFGLSLLVRFGL